MKKRILFLMICIVVIVLGAFILCNKNMNEFNMPEETKLAIAYTSGPRLPYEHTVVNYLDESGEFIELDQFDSRVENDCISHDPVTGKNNLFTHEAVYFEKNKTPLCNTEMEETYRFASDNGNDEVYVSGYLEDPALFYKHIPHGLSYGEKELGNVDLLTFYNEKKVYNVHIEVAGCVAENQDESALYNFDGDSENVICYERIEYDEEKDDFNVTTGEIDLNQFFEKRMPGETIVFGIGKTVFHKRRAYQILYTGEGEESRNYLVEYGIDEKENRIVYIDDYLMPLEWDETLDFNVPAAISEGKITWYCSIKPNEIMTFDMEEKTFTSIPLLEGLSFEEQQEVLVREINGEIYVLKYDIDDMKFVLYQIQKDNTLKELCSGDLPEEAKSILGLYLEDFFVRP